MPPKNKPLSAKQESPVGEKESLFWEERLWLRVLSEKSPKAYMSLQS